MNATLNFAFYNSAKSFARKWALFSARGYTLGARNKNGGATLTLDNVTEIEKVWIDKQITIKNKKK